MDVKPTATLFDGEHPAMHILIQIDASDEIDVSFHATAEAARHALMRDLYESYQGFDLPDEDTDEAISSFLCENDLSLTYKIAEVPSCKP